LERKKKGPYSKGEINAIIDSLIHPLMKDHPWLVLVDGLLHALNEQNPQESLEKFLKYNANRLAKAIIEELKKYE